MRKPPSVIYVGPHDYEVKVKKHLDLLGETMNNDTTILVRRRQSLSNLRDTLVHEMLHAILFQSGVLQTLGISHDNEESLVVTISPWILQAIQDNPELISFLTDSDAIEAA